MKLREIIIQNFKRFTKEERFSFVNEATGQVNDQVLIVGDNGSGKTTLLQAIALLLSSIMRVTPSLEQFDWPGWCPERYYYGGTPIIKGVLELSLDEWDKTRAAAKEWFDKSSDYPGERNTDFLFADEHRPESGPVLINVGLQGGQLLIPQREHLQFALQGRWYARQLLRHGPAYRTWIDALPGIEWFHQFRNLASMEYVASLDLNEDSTDLKAQQLQIIRTMLLRWHLYHFGGSNGKKAAPDYYNEIQKLFAMIFPDRSFAGVEPGMDDEPQFVLTDGTNRYELMEMSGGEQQVLPILMRMVAKRVHHSVVLVDEIDLNLHAPAARKLVFALSKLGNDNQFFVTTHSKTVASLFNEYETLSLDGGVLCL